MLPPGAPLRFFFTLRLESDPQRTVYWRPPASTYVNEDGVSEAMRHLSLEPKRDESKTEPVPAGYTVVAAVLQHLDETRLLPTFLAQQIDDAALPYLEPTDLIELGVAPMTCLAILGAANAGGKATARRARPPGAAQEPQEADAGDGRAQAQPRKPSPARGAGAAPGDDGAPDGRGARRALLSD